MAGYLPDEANADAFDDGWYRTGDVGWLEPEGWVHLTDRSKEMIKVNGFQVAPGRDRGRAPRPPGRARLRGVRRPRRAGRRGAGRRRAARPRATRWPTASSSGSWPTRSPPTSTCATSSWSTPSPGSRRARCCAARCATSGRRSSPRDGRLMDVRLSPEQQAPARLRRPGRRPARPARRRRARRRRAGRQARRRRRRPPGWRELRAADDDGAPLASGVEAAIVAEELGRGLADAAVPRTDPGRRAAPPGRRARAPTTPETVAAHRRPRCARRSRRPVAPPAGAVAVDARGAAAALVAGDRRPAATRSAGSRLGAAPSRTDLTRRLATVRPRRRRARAGPAAGRSTDDDLTAWTALGLALAVRRPRRHDARRGRPRHRLRQGPPAVRQPDRLVPGRAAPAGRRLRGHGGLAQRRPARGLGGRRARRPPTRWPPRRVAKAYCARAARTVCETAIQVHGGIGNTWECLAHVHLRRALLSTDVLGGVGPSLDRVLAHHGIGGGRGLR